MALVFLPSPASIWEYQMEEKVWVSSRSGFWESIYMPPDLTAQKAGWRLQVTAGWKAPEKKTLREREKVQGDLCNLSLRRLGFRERLQDIKD